MRLRSSRLSSWSALSETSQTLAGLVKAEAESQMKKFVELAKSKGLAVSTRGSSMGSAAPTIVEAAQKGDYDLIALGTHGRTGFSHLLLGSVAEKVVRQADRPVLTVREAKPAAPLAG